ncbi:MAG: hypothetical protein IKC46_09795 [Lachnospiraceae bacterium]|nr:hypothetical protein [Lachnospiraceae bacterium]
MFGYIIVNKQEMKFREYDCYRSYYCGLCRELKSRYGLTGQMTLSFDMTFLVVLLTGLYEPETVKSSCKCIAHPFEKHPTSINRFTEYAADMNILLSYYKCLDDWTDERKLLKLTTGAFLKKKNAYVTKQYPKKAEKIYTLLEQIHLYEKTKEANLDLASGCFGEIMAEIFAWREDEWEQILRRMGFYLGKFIYLMDAYEDREKDLKSGNYNPFLLLQQHMENEETFEKQAYTILEMMMAECSRAFEQLPILEHVEILRNILYSGIWCRYEMLQRKKDKKDA